MELLVLEIPNHWINEFVLIFFFVFVSGVLGCWPSLLSRPYTDIHRFSIVLVILIFMYTFVCDGGVKTRYYISVTVTSLYVQPTFPPPTPPLLPPARLVSLTFFLGLFRQMKIAIATAMISENWVNLNVCIKTMFLQCKISVYDSRTWYAGSSQNLPLTYLLTLHDFSVAWILITHPLVENL